ncbi:unnamed protein product, partial [Heterotrigona itama]
YPRDFNPQAALLVATLLDNLRNINGVVVGQNRAIIT